MTLGPSGAIYAWTYDAGFHVDGSYNVTHGLEAVSRDGVQLWKYYLGPERASPPAVSRDGVIYCTSGNRLYAIWRDGSLKWTFPAAGNDCRMPVVDQHGLIYFTARDDGAAGSTLYAVNPDGKAAWSRRMPAPTDQWNPVVGLDGAVYLMCEDYRLYVVEPGGALRWSYRTGDCFAKPLVDGQGTVYLSGSDSRLYALNAGGSLKWWYAMPASSSSPPVMAEDGTLYVVAGTQLIAIGPGSQMPQYTAAGYVKDSGGQGIPGVQVSITGEDPVLTDANGYWSKTGLADGIYLVTPAKSGVTFSPAFAELHIAGANAVVPDFASQPRVPPQWPMWAYDRAHTGCCPYIGPSSANVRWQTELGQRNTLPPVIGADGAIYIGGAEGGLWALNPDGTIRWSASTMQTLFNENINTPVISADGTVLTDVGPVVFAYTPNGALTWTYKDSFFGLDNVLALTGDGATIVSGITALDQDGAERWRFVPSKADGPFHTPAIAEDGMLYLSGSSTVIALTPGLIETWDVQLEGLEKSATATFPPVLGADGAVYVACGRQLYALNADGSQRWVLAFSSSLVSSPALAADGTLYLAQTSAIAVENIFWAVSPDGVIKWGYPSGGETWRPSPLVDGAGTVYTALGNYGAMYAFNPDGTVQWMLPTCIETGAPALGADGVLYFGSKWGMVYAVGPGGG